MNDFYINLDSQYIGTKYTKKNVISLWPHKKTLPQMIKPATNKANINEFDKNRRRHMPMISYSSTGAHVIYDMITVFRNVYASKRAIKKQSTRTNKMKCNVIDEDN